MRKKTDLIIGVQGLRAVAAILVLLQHCIYFSCVAKNIDYSSLKLIDFGRIGTSLFFIISGYVMTLCLSQGKNFMLNRIIRIYPSFWIAIILSGIIFHFLGKPWVFNFYSITLFPVPFSNDTYQIPYWTLIYEMFFYSVIYLFILLNFSRNKIFYTLLAWALGIIITAQFQLTSNISPLLPGKFIIFSPLCLLFITGALYGLKGGIQFKNIPSSFLIINTLILFIYSHFYVMYSYCIEVLCWCITYIMVLELSQRSKNIPTIIAKLGDYSYGLYLMHMVWINVALYLVIKYMVDYKFLICFIFILCISFSGGTIFGMIDYFIYKNKLKPWSNKIKLILNYGSTYTQKPAQQ